MLKDIKVEFEKLVWNLNWMDYKTKILNIEKANAIVDFIGYEQKHLDIANIDQYYSDVSHFYSYGSIKGHSHQYKRSESQLKDWIPL